MKTYELICDEHVVTGMFFYDEVLGSFFITDKIDYELTTLKNVDFVYNDNMINLVITKENKYNIYNLASLFYKEKGKLFDILQGPTGEFQS